MSGGTCDSRASSTGSHGSVGGATTTVRQPCPGQVAREAEQAERPARRRGRKVIGHNEQRAQAKVLSPTPSGCQGCVPRRGRPTGRARARSRRPGQGLQTGGDDPIRVQTNQHVCPLFHSHRPFGVVPERQTGNAQHRGFFLEAPGVGEDESGMRHQFQEIEVAQRIDETQAGSTAVGPTLKGLPPADGRGKRSATRVADGPRPSTGP